MKHPYTTSVGFSQRPLSGNVKGVLTAISSRRNKHNPEVVLLRLLRTDGTLTVVLDLASALEVGHSLLRNVEMQLRGTPNGEADD